VHTWVNIRVEVPLEAKYRPDGSGDSYTEQRISSIDGLDGGVMSTVGALVIVFAEGRFWVKHYAGEEDFEDWMIEDMMK
jgi:hypothetical protein